jgi:hypothetical protein
VTGEVPVDPATGQAPATLLGWRIWLLNGGHLAAWAMSYTWAPGPNTASCLSAHLERGDHRPPGTRCRCGFWALSDPADCPALLKKAAPADGVVLGLIRAWGQVAIHGKEGFRAEHASVACLFSDRFMDGMPRWVTRLDERGWTVRARHLRRASELYGVPLVSLRTAYSSGLLAEFGVTASPERLIGATW